MTRIHTMKQKPPIMNKLQWLTTAIFGKSSLEYARRRKRSIPVKDLVDFVRYCDSCDHDPESLAELGEWIENGVAFAEMPSPGKPSADIDITPRSLTNWLARQAGENPDRRVKILKIFKWVRRCWPES